jgi:hypothetical protein
MHFAESVANARSNLLNVLEGESRHLCPWQINPASSKCDYSSVYLPHLSPRSIAANEWSRDGHYLRFHFVGAPIGQFPGCSQGEGDARVVALASAEAGPSDPFMTAVTCQR